MFTAELVDNVTAKLPGLTPSVLAELKLAVNEQTITLQGYIVSQKLTGQVLGVRSGALRRSIQQEPATVTGSAVAGRVYSAGDVKYAAFWEYGFHGVETVKQHMRHVVFGKDVAPFSVGPYSRKVDQDARSFMRSALTERKEAIVQSLGDAAKRGLAAAMGHAS